MNTVEDPPGASGPSAPSGAGAETGTGTATSTEAGVAVADEPNTREVDDGGGMSTPAISLSKERREGGPSLAGGLPALTLLAAALPTAALLWTLSTSPQTPVTMVTASQTNPTTSAPSPTTAAAISDARAAVDALKSEDLAAAIALADAVVRATEAERGERIRLLQRSVATARDARRVAGQAGPALRGPFPVSELGDLAPLSLSTSRWLVGRDGRVLLPANTTGPEGVDLAAPGRDEAAAVIDAVVDGVPRKLIRRCVPFEAYCIVDVEGPATAPPNRLSFATLEAALSAAATTTTTAAATPKTPSAATTTTTTASPPLWALAALCVVGLGAAVVVVRRLRGLSAVLRVLTFKLRGGAAAKIASPPLAVAELAALNAAIDAIQTAAGDGAADDEARAWRRQRLLALAQLLRQAMERGGAPRVPADERDDIAVARAIDAANAICDTADARARRMKLGLDEVASTRALLAPLAQRLLRLSRVPDLPAAAVDELASLGSAIGARARRPTVLPALLDEVARLVPAGVDIMSTAEAVSPLDDGAVVRLGTAAMSAEASEKTPAAPSAPTAPSTPPSVDEGHESPVAEPASHREATDTPPDAAPDAPDPPR
jgi:hypothetical protein